MMKKHLNIVLMSLLVGVSLTACSSTPNEQTQYYQLPNSAFHAPTATRNAEIAVQIRLAEHLKSPSLLYQTDEVHLNFAQKNVWAAPLAESLASNLANKLNHQNQRFDFIPQHLANPKTSQIMMIYFDRFQGNYLGKVEISGYAQLPNGKRQHFSVQMPQHGDGYSAMVQALDMALNQVVQNIDF